MMERHRRKGIKNLKRFVEKLENSKVPFVYLILIFFVSVTLRNFLEVLFSGAKLDTWMFLHFYLYYAALFLVLVLFFRFFTGVEIKKIARTILPFFTLIIFAPIVDIILSGGKGFTISYLLPDIHNDILIRFFTFGGGFAPAGMTPGIKLVALVALLFAFFYFYSKKLGFIKSFFCIFLIYVCGFCFLLVPFFLKFVSDFLGVNLLDSWDIVFSSIYAVLIFVLGALVFYFSDKKRFFWLLGGKGGLRLVHYELMFFAGVFIGLKSGVFVLSGENIFQFVLIPIGIFCVGISSAILNDVADSELKAGKANEGLAGGFLLLGLFYSAIANFFSAAVLLFGACIFFIYSAPPLRLKRFPFISKFFLSLNSLILVILGYSLAGNQIISFPLSITVFFLVGVSLAINFIDLKDLDEDKKNGIKTLPVLLGMKNAKLLIGTFFVAAYFLAYFIFNNPLLLMPLVFFAALEFCLINKENYDEKLVFIVYLASIVFLLPFY
ncbi:MAG: UbiA family prenyltransferase [Candidatus Diapherotrites archaeon]|nr:UbiA family prenyltransferase [Candidatus Diapherotrites archaeon]